MSLSTESRVLVGELCLAAGAANVGLAVGAIWFHGPALAAPVGFAFGLAFMVVSAFVNPRVFGRER